MTNWAILGLIFFAANLPWFSDKLFYLVSLNRSAKPGFSKNLGWCLLELVILYFLTGGFIWYAEHATLGQVAPQGWEFYAVTACLFLVFAFPGFVYKVLWKRAI
jgi:hypothetical protein